MQKIKKVPDHSVCAVDQQMHTGALSYIINYPHVSVAVATIISVFTRILTQYNKPPYCVSKTTSYCYSFGVNIP